MKKVNAEKIVLEDLFVEMSEECQIATEGGCSGCGSITSGITIHTKYGEIKW